MKRTLLIVAAIGTLTFTSCEKEELTVPENTLEAKTQDCNCGGGSWDIIESAPVEPKK
jgi:hypothetical protein